MRIETDEYLIKIENLGDAGNEELAKNLKEALSQWIQSRFTNERSKCAQCNKKFDRNGFGKRLEIPIMDQVNDWIRGNKSNYPALNGTHCGTVMWTRDS